MKHFMYFKHYQHQVLSPIGKFFFFCCFISFCIFSAESVSAQFAVFDVPQEIEQGITTATTVYNTVKTITDEVERYKELYQKINNGIRTYHQVTSTIRNINYMINTVVGGMNYLRTAKNLTVTQVSSMILLYKYYLEQLNNYVNDLYNLISEIFNMSDGERMKAIDQLSSKSIKLGGGINYLDNKIRVTDLLIGSKKQDLQDVKDYYTALAADEAAVTETPDSARNTIHGFFGDLAKFLYVVSAIVALIGAVKVYSQFVTGSEEVWQTATSWFGACLFIVAFVSFLSLFL